MTGEVEREGDGGVWEEGGVYPACGGGGARVRVLVHTKWGW